MKMRWMALGLVVIVVAGVFSVWLFFHLQKPPDGPPTTPPDRADDHHPDDKGSHDPTTTHAAGYRPAPINLVAAGEFLYAGASGRQRGVDKAAVKFRQAALLRGLAVTTDGAPLVGVEVTVYGHPEFGRTVTGADGTFDLAVNGGGWLTVAYRKEGLLPAWRQVSVPWQDYAFLPDVTLLPSAPPFGVLELSAEEPERVLRNKAVEDKDGKRQATLLAPKGLEAVMFLPEGDKQSPNRLNLQLTEYTAAPRASAALPAPPPPGTACAYAVELSAAEAVQAGARDVQFKKSVIHYVENTLKFPTGTVLPVSRFVADKTAWLAAPDGRVVELLNVTEDGAAELDVDGGGKAADADALAKLGVTEAERRQLAGLYKPHDKLWRIPLAHLGTFAVLPPTRLPEGAVAPRWGLARLASESPADPAGGSRLDASPQVVRQAVPVTGTPYQLVYQSDRVPGGRKGAYNVSVSLTGAELPKGLSRVEVEVLVAGLRITQRHPIPQPNVTVGFTWDGKDAFGRPVQGARPAVVRVGYFYDATYPYPAGGPGVPAREPAALWTEQHMMLGDWDARGQDLGGWTLDALHSYDPVGRVLHLGGGGRRDGRALPLVIDRFVGGRVGVGLLKDIGDDGPALRAALSTVRGLAVGPDGALYLADAGQNRVRRVDAAGIITTVAGSANEGYDGDGRPGPDAKMRGPAGLAVAPDGSLYIADDGNDRIRRVGPDGFIHTVAGRGGRDEYAGDGGLAQEAKLSRIGGLAAGPPDGSLYVAQNAFYQCVRRIGPDGVINRLPAKAEFGSACGIALTTNGVLYLADAEGNRVWRIAPDGTATVAAGTGKAGFNGDGGPAPLADLNAPTAVAAGLDGMLYIADAANQRIRRVDPNGVITTVAGSGLLTTSQSSNGDGGPAPLATFQLTEQTHGQPSFLSGLAVGPDGDLYVADDQGRHVRRIASPFSGFSEGEITLSAFGDRERYVFDGAGRHLRTLDPAGKVVRRFVYDKAGRLAEIHDAADAATRVDRDAEGAPTALVAPDGRRTALQVGADGYLSRITDPAGGAVQMAYDAEGLLSSYTDAHGTVGFKYDEAGRVVK